MIIRIVISVLMFFSSTFLIPLCIHAQNSFVSELYFSIWVLCLISWIFFMITGGKLK